MAASSAEANIKELADLLAQTAERIGHDDLTELARMHGWCQSLAQPAPETDDPFRERAAALARKLEELIIGEEQEAALAYARIASEAHGLAELVGLLNSQLNVQPTDPAEDGSSAGQARAGYKCSPTPQAAAPPAHRSTAETTAASPAAQSTAYEQVPLIIGPKEMEYIKGFVEEGGEHVQAIEAALLEIERTPDDTSKIDELFRPFHTVKGLAGFLNLRDINCLTHEAETLLDQARKGTRRITPAIIDLIFNVVDILKLQIGHIAAHLVDPRGEVVEQPPIASMIEQLRATISGASPEEGVQAFEESAAASVSTLATGPVGTGGKEAGRANPSGPAATDFSVRIDTAKLDALVDMVGELVIAHTLVAGNSATAENARLIRDVGQVGKIVRDIQELAMSMRMVPIGPTFQKMERLVRDLSRRADKRIELSIAGQDTELDKNVIQQISDPLVHMVRNAVDHGIEPPDERAARGKDPAGHVHLSAFHQGGSIVITIQDDGRGLDADALVAHAVKRGVVAPNAELSEQQAFALIFAPGFSTAKAVTDISGRGVGMDVVKRNIEQLRGKIDIRSRKGEGTTFSIMLPLTLAIIDGMVVRVGSERFVIPTIHIEQALRPTPAQITTVQQRGQLLQTRGRLLPIVQLGELFHLGPRVDPCQAMVVIVQTNRETVGLTVDELIGQQQVVIKSLGSRFEKLRGISGAAILGDGRVGLILEVSGLRAEQQIDKE